MMKLLDSVLRISDQRPPLWLVQDAEQLARRHNRQIDEPWRHSFRPLPRTPGVCAICYQVERRHRLPLWRRLVAWLVGDGAMRETLSKRDKDL